jgi:hypothetical protein
MSESCSCSGSELGSGGDRGGAGGGFMLYTMIPDMMKKKDAKYSTWNWKTVIKH